MWGAISVNDTGDRRAQHACTHAHARAWFRVLMCTRMQACMTGTHIFLNSVVFRAFSDRLVMYMYFNRQFNLI